METVDIMNKVMKLFLDRNFSLAKEEANKLLELIKDYKIEDDQNIHLTFSNNVEALLYDYKFRPEKINKTMEINVSYLYYILGYIAIEEQDVDSALMYLNKSLEWNPVNTHTLFEKCEIYKRKNDIINMKKTLDFLYDLIYRGNLLAKYCRLLGYYLIEMKEYDLATAVYKISLVYGKTEEDKMQVYNEFRYIEKITGKSIEKQSLQEIADMCKAKGIPVTYSYDTIGLLEGYFNYFYKPDEVTPFIKQLASILYNITHDEKFNIN